MAEGLTPADPQIQELNAQLQALTQNHDIIVGMQRLGNSISSAFSQTLQGVLQGTQTFGEAMKNLFRNLVLAISNEIMQLAVIDPFKKALGGMFGGGGGFDILSLLGLGGGGGGGSPAGFTFDLGGAFSAVPFLADGGIVRSPRLVMAGEAGPEAIIPLGNKALGATNYYIDARGAQRGVSIEIRQAIEEAKRESIKMSVSAVKSERQRSAGYARAFRG